MAEAEFDYLGTSVGVQGGIYGLGMNAKGKFTDKIGAKISFDKWTYKDIETEDEKTKYVFDVTTQDFLATLDWHPWAGSFVLRGGMIVNDTNLVGDITPNTQGADTIEFEFNDKQYSYKTDELGSIRTYVDFDPVAPYVGFGWDTSFTSMKGFGFTFDLGVAHQGAAKAKYDLIYGAALDIDKEIKKETANIPDGAAKEAKIAEIKNDINSKRKKIEDDIKRDLDKEMNSLQDELNKYEWMPYIAIGVNYKF